MGLINTLKLAREESGGGCIYVRLEEGGCLDTSLSIGCSFRSTARVILSRCLNREGQQFRGKVRCSDDPSRPRCMLHA